MSEILTPKKLSDRLTDYAVKSQDDKTMSSTLLAAAQMIRKQHKELERKREEAKCIKQ